MDSVLRELLAESVRLRLVADVPVGVFLSGVSFYSLRDDHPGDFDRAEHLKDILNCLTGSSHAVTEAAPASRYSLAQNVPNPFNPVTTIEFEPGAVRDLDHNAGVDAPGHVQRDRILQGRRHEDVGTGVEGEDGSGGRHQGEHDGSDDKTTHQSLLESVRQNFQATQ